MLWAPHVLNGLVKRVDLHRGNQPLEERLTLLYLLRAKHLGRGSRRGRRGVGRAGQRSQRRRSMAAQRGGGKLASYGLQACGHACYNVYM